MCIYSRWIKRGLLVEFSCKSPLLDSPLESFAEVSILRVPLRRVVATTLSIKLSYIKSSPWLKLIGYSNSLCARATRAITNHVPIGKYWLRFFPKENFNCLYKSYLIKSRCHILHECRRYNNCWNPDRESLSHFIAFLKFNPGAFSFHKGITW